jgi:hypothetical protein
MTVGLEQEFADAPVFFRPSVHTAATTNQQLTANSSHRAL